MSKPSAKKNARRKAKEQKRKYRERPHLAKKEMAARFPEILYDGTASEWLMTEVKNSLRDIVSEHHKLLPSAVVDAFRRAKVEGFSPVLKDIRKASRVAAVAAAMGEMPSGEPPVSREKFLLALGESLFDRLPSSVWENHFPFEDVMMHFGKPRRNTILVQFRELERAKTSGGTTYHSPFRPKVAVKGTSRIVAFSRHAAEQICNRCVANWKTYAGLGEAFGFLNDCVYFEPWVDARGASGFAVYRKCVLGFATALYVSEILGKKVTRTSNYYHRVGYCPGVDERGLLKALTLLLPGMRGTPEAIWARKNMSRKESRELEERADEIEYRKLAKSENFSLLKRFHEGGIKQVVTLKQDVFRRPEVGRVVGRRPGRREHAR